MATSWLGESVMTLHVMDIYDSNFDVHIYHTYASVYPRPDKNARYIDCHQRILEFEIAV